VNTIKKLNEIAAGRKQSLAQMALSWLLKDKRITSVLIGASSIQQLENNLDALQNLNYTSDELDAIEKVLA
jgi:L-glyceraldehyde 3-phosphate reductase